MLIEGYGNNISALVTENRSYTEIGTIFEKECE
jgi:hypothetical protein